jgi:hypothetical protein
MRQSIFRGTATRYLNRPADRQDINPTSTRGVIKAEPGMTPQVVRVLRTCGAILHSFLSIAFAHQPIEIGKPNSDRGRWRDPAQQRDNTSRLHLHRLHRMHGLLRRKPLPQFGQILLWRWPHLPMRRYLSPASLGCLAAHSHKLSGLCKVRLNHKTQLVGNLESSHNKNLV